MAEIICHHNGKYNIYGTIADGFYFNNSLSLKELKTYITKEFGQRGLERLPMRLERAHANGHSALYSESLDDFLCANKAGENESHLSTEECVKRFLS